MKGTLSRIWELASNRRKTLVEAVGFSFLRNVFGVAEMLAILAGLAVFTGTLDVEKGIWFCSIMTVVCVAGSYFCSLLEQQNGIKSAMFMVSDKRRSLAGHLRRIPLGLFHRDMSTRITATMTTTLSGLEMASSMAMIGIVSGLFNSVMFCLFLLCYEWRVGIFMALGIVLYMLVVALQMKLSRKQAPSRQKAQTELASHTISFTRGIRVIKAFCVESGDESLKKAIDDSRDENIALTDRSIPTQMLSFLIIAIFESILVAMTVYLTVNDLGMDVTKSIVLLIFSYIAFASLNQAGSILSMIGMIESGLDEMDEIEKLPELKTRNEKALPESDEIEMKQVHFSYGDREVVKGVSECFRPGTLTAIIGPSGAGKTTLCQLIARFHEVTSGSIEIGGVDIRDIPYDELMRKFSIVFQDTYLFEDTIAGNIRFGKPDATDEEVREAARKAQCDEFIMKLPDGYETMVEEGGKSLSGGEKQRIAIARAILKDSPVIILDEATSALDAENEDAFFKAIENLMKNKTVIMIAHRLSSVERADRVIAVRDGLVVEEGTPEELSSRPGLYRDFLDSRIESRNWTL